MGGSFQLCYLAAKLIHQLDELAGVSIADSTIGRLQPMVPLILSCHQLAYPTGAKG